MQKNQLQILCQFIEPFQRRFKEEPIRLGGEECVLQQRKCKDAHVCSCIWAAPLSDKYSGERSQLLFTVSTLEGMNLRRGVKLQRRNPRSNKRPYMVPRQILLAERGGKIAETLNEIYGSQI